MRSLPAASALLVLSQLALQLAACASSPPRPDLTTEAAPGLQQPAAPGAHAALEELRYFAGIWEATAENPMTSGREDPTGFGFACPSRADHRPAWVAM